MWGLRGKDPASQCRGMQIAPLLRDDPLEREMVTHSSILAWEIPWTEGVWQATVHGVAKSQPQLKD